MNIYKYAENLHLHYFGEGGIVYTKSKCFYLNRSKLLIFEICDNKTFDEIIEMAVSYFKKDFSDSVILAIKTCLDEFIRNELVLITTNSVDHSKPTISGEKNKYYPYKIAIELTNRCNLNCEYCYNSSSPFQNTFIPKDKLECIIKMFKGKTKEIQLIGGEPLLYPDIDEIISAFTEHFNVSLTTNGVNINKLSIDTIKKLDSIIISIYGYNHDSFALFTKNNVFNRFEKSLDFLHSNKIPYAAAITITKENFLEIEKYIEQLINWHTPKVVFGLPVVSGRASNNKDKWILNEDEIKKTTHLLKILTIKYYSKIEIEYWKSSKVKLTPLLPQDFEPICYLCGGGLLDFTVSADLKIKPCGYLPSESCTITFKDLPHIVSGNKNDLLKNSKKHINKYLEDTHIKTINICNLIQ